MQRFGEKLRTLRELQGMTKQRLADELGFSDVYVHYLETGQRKPNIALLLKLVTLFNVSSDELVLDELELHEDLIQRFGEKLHTLRKRHHMTLMEMAHALGYTSESHMSLVEAGKRNPTAELTFKVSQLFNVSADVLLNDDLELEE